MSARPTALPFALSRRVAYGADLALFLLATVTLAVVVNYFAHRPELRTRIDATRTRAYSLSPQTRELLGDLDGEWTIALIMVDDESNAAVRSQVDEVLQRFAGATPAISVVAVDPTDPATLDEYEGLLGRLRAIEGDRIAAYDDAIAAGQEAFDTLRIFAQQQAAQLEIALGHLGANDPGRGELQQRLGLLALLADEGGKVTDAVTDALRVGGTQPLPDYETARSILVSALTQWADELLAMAGIYRSWSAGGDANPVLAGFAAGAFGPYEQLAQELAIAADPLLRLPPLELASIGRQLETGETAVIIGPERSAVIPSQQLFPKLNVRALGDETVAFDRRFRGEQAIAAAIRSLLVERMPMVVFVHASESSLLGEQDGRSDVVGIASTLQVCRFDVREWAVTATERPVAAEGQPVVWVVVPPTSRQGLEPQPPEQTLIRATRSLIAAGESVCLSVYPSLLPRFRQRDPWQTVAAPFGLEPDTAHVVFDVIAAGAAEEQYQPSQSIIDLPHDHAIARAVHGQPAYFPLPVPVIMIETAGVRHDVIASVEPDGRRWLEPEWATKMKSRDPAVRGAPLREAAPVVVAAERAAPDGRARQRLIVVGSGGWMLSSVADVLLPVGGGRMALEHPGNQELLLAAVAWLAGQDQLIAPSPVSQQVARLDGIGKAGQIAWGVMTVIGLPLLCLVLGAGVWLGRRATV